MATKCHMRAWYLFETFAGMAAYVMRGRRKRYLAVCSRCNRKHELTASEANKGLKESRKWQA